MCSDRRSQPARPGRALRGTGLGLALALALGLAIAGCGNKRPPRAPPRMVPRAATDLQVSQRGTELQFAFAYPDVTIGGHPLPGIEAVELWRMTRPLQPAPPEDEEEEEGADEDAETDEEDAEPAEEELAEEQTPTAASPFLFRRPPEIVLQAEQRIEVGPLEFAALAALELRIEAAELQAAISGDRLLLRLPLDELPPPEVPEEERDLEVFAVLTVSSRGLDSPFSNVVTILPRTPPEPPEQIETLPDARGVDVIWKAEDPPVGFRVYRRDAASRAYGTPIAQPGPTARTHLDRTTSFGSRYVYSVTAVALESPLVESALAAEREVQYDDRYPPAPPTGVLVLGEPGRARVLWEPSVADDLAGYLVYRRTGGDAGFDRLTAEPVLELSYLDAEVAAGRSYSYYLSAVDLNGNESEASKTVDVVIP